MLQWLRAKHILRSDTFVEVLLGHNALVKSSLTEGKVFLVRVLREVGCGIVTYHRIEGRDQHQGLGEMSGDAVMIGSDSTDAVVGEGCADVTEEPRGLKHGMHHHRLKHVEFKLTAAARDAHRDVVAHHLCSDHRHCLTLGRVHLTCNNQTAPLLLLLLLEHQQKIPVISL